MCSAMTIASSMISPTAAAMPPRVMMLKLWPRAYRTPAVMASTTGTLPAATSVSRQSRRNSSSTTAASATPITTASRTPVAEPVIRSLWSYQQVTVRSAGSRPRSAARAARMPAAMSTVFPPGCW